MSTEIGRIEITYVIEDDGDIVSEVEVKGDIPFVTQIGLLEMAKDSLFNGSEEDEDYE